MPINFTAIPNGNAATSTAVNNALTELDNAIKKNNYAATGAPTTGDDSDDGYSVGSRWIDTTNDRAYVALDVTVGAAVWKEITVPATIAALTVTALTTTTIDVATLTASSKVYLNDTSNANMTQGVTLNQGANDDEILALKSSDVAHGITTVAETDTYGTLSKAIGADGGVMLAGYSDATVAVRLAGRHTTDDTAKATTASAPVFVTAQLKSGTGVTDVAANGNLFAVRNNATTRAVIDAEGDLHLDGASNATAWDDHDDLALLETYRVLTANPDFKKQFAKNIRQHARVLAKTGVLTLNEDGHHFVSIKGLLGLIIDTIRQSNYQTHLRLEALEHGKRIRGGDRRRNRAVAKGKAAGRGHGQLARGVV